MKTITIKIAILLLLVSFSCQKKSNRETGPILYTQYSQPFFGDFLYENKIDLYSDTMRIYLDHFNFSDTNGIESLLKNIYFRDQQYRDSIQQYRNKVRSDKDLNDLKLKFYYKKFQVSDQINTEIVKHIISKIGWPDTRRMDYKAQYAFWFTIFHSHDIEFITNTSIYLEKAFNDSIISPQYYASLMDKIYVRSGKKQIYGTYPSFDKNEKRIIIPQISVSVDSINVQRELIGLDRIDL